MKKYFFAVLLVFLSLNAKSEIIFEGYYKIVKETVPIGYSILRFEHDPKQKIMIATSFIKTAPKFNDLTESYVVKSNEGYQPLFMQFTSIDNTKRKTVIDAKVVGENLQATVISNGPPKNINLKLKKGVFFSVFLPYLMLQSGLKTSTRFTYSAIAEESAEIKDGEAVISKNMEDHKGQKVFKVTNKFMNIQYSSLLSAAGEILHVDSPAQQTYTELTTKEDAIQGMPFPQSIITTLFGGVPAGLKNSLRTNTPAKGVSVKPPPSQGE